MTAKSKQRSNSASISRKKSNSERGKEFRAKRRKYETELVSVVFTLRKEVDDLQMSIKNRDELMVNQRGKIIIKRAFQMITDYCYLFRNGILRTSCSGGSAPSELSVDVELCDEQLQFLSVSMTEDVVYGTSKGVAAIIDFWKRISLAYSDITLVAQQIEHIDVDEVPLLIATLDIHVFVKKETFTSVISNMSQECSIIKGIMGKKLRYRTVKHFYFNEHGKVMKYQTEMDIVQALVELNIQSENVKLMFEQALLEYHGSTRRNYIDNVSGSISHLSKSFSDGEDPKNDSVDGNKHGLKFLLW